MVRRTVLFFLGVLFGLAIDMTPHAIETVAQTNVCRESCSYLLRGTSLAIYAIMPIAWGCLATTTTRRPFPLLRLVNGALGSLALMTLLTWFLYRRQHH